MTTTMRIDTSKPFNQHLNPIKPPKLPIELLQRILKPENLSWKQSLGVPGVCREWYMLGQRLIWQEMTVTVGNPATTYPQQEAFLDQPKFRSFCTSLSVIFDLRLAKFTTDPREKLASETERLQEIMARLSPLKNFGLHFLRSDNNDGTSIQELISNILEFGHPITHVNIEQKDLRRLDLNLLLLKCTSLKYLKIECTLDFPISLDLESVQAPLHTLFIAGLTRDGWNIASDIVKATSTTLRSIILAGDAANTIAVLHSLSPHLDNLERFELQFTDIAYITQMTIENLLIEITVVLLQAPKVKEISFGPIFYPMRLFSVLPDIEFWKSGPFWNTINKEVKIIVRFDPSKEQSGIPFLARQQLKALAHENGNEVGIHMIGETASFPFSRP